MALNVLVVDDSATTRAVIGKSLRLADLPIQELHEAANGAEALAVLKQHWIDLVFSDLHMPVMDGFALVDQMAQDDLLCSIPIVIVSSEGSTTRRNQLSARGIREYLQKPVTPEQLREAVGRFLEDRPDER